MMNLSYTEREDDGERIEIIGERRSLEKKHLLVKHKDNGHTYSRRVTFEGSLTSLRREILKIYDAMLVPKIAAETRMSQSEVRERDHVLAEVLYLTIWDDKFGQFVQIMTDKDVNHGDTIVVEIVNNKANPDRKGKNVVVDGDDDDGYDLALEIRSMKLHIHVSGKEDHQFVPYWCYFDKLKKATGRLEGIYSIWCPVYSNGQGYLSIGDAISYEQVCDATSDGKVYSVSISGWSTSQSIEPSKQTSTDVKIVKSPSGDECNRIYFLKENAYLGYLHKDGVVVGVAESSMQDPEKKSAYNFDFKIIALSDEYAMYYHIFSADGDKKTDSHFLQVTQTDGLVRVIQDVQPGFKNPSSLFTLYQVPSTISSPKTKAN